MSDELLMNDHATYTIDRLTVMPLDRPAPDSLIEHCGT